MQTVDTALAHWGLQADATDPAASAPVAESKVFYIWPECLGTWVIWQRLQTQWRIGADGREGLDYAGVSAYLREVLRIKTRHLADTFNELQAMETAALDVWAKQRDKNK